MSNVLRHAPWIMAIWAALPVTPVVAQGNIDAGKTPAQIFGDTCSACHRSARELKRASASFLRTHYSTGADEAAAMASYLAGVTTDPRAQTKRPPNEVGKQTPTRPAAAEQPKSAQSAPGQAKSRPPNLAAQTRPAPVAEERPPDPPLASPPPPAPVLEPFEE